MSAKEIKELSAEEVLQKFDKESDKRSMSGMWDYIIKAICILFAIFLVFLFMGMPVAYAMSISAVVTLFFDNSLPGLIIPQKMFTAMDSFSLMAIPFFMLAGSRSFR